MQYLSQLKYILINQAHTDGGPRSFSLFEQGEGLNLLETPNRKTNNLILYTETDRIFYYKDHMKVGFIFIWTTHNVMIYAHRHTRHSITIDENHSTDRPGD